MLRQVAKTPQLTACFFSASAGFQILVTLSSQLLGYAHCFSARRSPVKALPRSFGVAGLTRRFLVYPRKFFYSFKLQNHAHPL